MGWWVYPLDPGIYCFSTEASQQKSPLGPETRDISSPTHPHLSLLLGGDGRGLWDFGTPMERIKLIVKAMEIGLESPFGGKKTYFKISRSWNTLRQKKPNPLEAISEIRQVVLSWPAFWQQTPAFAGLSRDSLKPAGAFSGAEMVNAIISYGWWKKSGEPLEMFFQPWNPNGGFS